MDTVRTMTGTFALATSVRRRETSAGDGPPDGRQGGSAVFDAEIKPGWDINGNANGGGFTKELPLLGNGNGSHD